jgi:acyl-coenzyme A thioesterase PaaI-like protein
MSSMSETDELILMTKGLKLHPLEELLDIRFEMLDTDSLCIKLATRDDLCGYPGGGILHGGVIAAVMDIMGGHIITWNRLKDVRDQPPQEQVKRLKNIGTIDLRVDYLRPAKGKEFTATASIIRAGNKIVVTRMELHNEQQILIAVGTGTYIVG